MLKLELESELDIKKDKGYKVEVIKDNTIYTKAVKDPLLILYDYVS